ncbi:hypothetical protein Misp01_33010 [Microtetraspora sp. NBRC 13810]|uniref:hypothetical protein n=1 Tax=Microtetraspora sp. NBRC 13810 TaxID=3030990 RepID=UPI0024A5F73C|nr:hypothetical protein [Microtetraspora sp. NBRC 13810]GLW08171.1 hypothetical protein Misp01_33010 [Microtetraspora sp. NBRC 13810]
MSWILAAVALAAAGLVVIAVFSVRVLVAARGLAGELAKTRARLAAEYQNSEQKNGVRVGRQG